jgi:hypothetical protein
MSSINRPIQSSNVPYQEYLTNKNEPKEEGFHEETSIQSYAGLLKSSFFQKNRMRQTARRLRDAS